MVSPLGANPQPPGPNALFSIRLYLISGRYMIPSGFISTSPGRIGCISSCEASLLKGANERPWKEEDQSTLLPVESTGAAEGGGVSGSSDNPSERERWFAGFVRSALEGAARLGVGTAGLGGVAAGFAVEVVGLETTEGDEGLEIVDVDVLRAVVVGRVRLTAAAAFVIALLEKLRCALLLRVKAALEVELALESAFDRRDASKLLQAGRACDATIIRRACKVWKTEDGCWKGKLMAPRYKARELKKKDKCLSSIEY
jgi:hypothetical protein